jgi:hypothetical protein
VFPSSFQQTQRVWAYPPLPPQTLALSIQSSLQPSFHRVLCFRICQTILSALHSFVGVPVYVKGKALGVLAQVAWQGSSNAHFEALGLDSYQDSWQLCPLT